MMIPRMRTTLDLDDDVLQMAKELAETLGTTAGKVVSDLARKGLAAPSSNQRTRNGVPLLARRPGGKRLTMKLVNELRDDL